MTKIMMFHNEMQSFHVYELAENDPMPYTISNSMLVSEFRGSSKSSILWTSVEAMEAWNATRSAYNAPIPFNYAFKRIWEGGHGKQSQHYAGVSFDVGQALSQAQRSSIHRIAQNLGVWSYVEPLYLTPTWVHFDKRYGTPACSAGYPLLRFDSIGLYVLILQDALNALGYNTYSLDGIFGFNTENALKAFQKDNNLSQDGICGCNTWQKITLEVVGIGLTPTVLEP